MLFSINLNFPLAFDFSRLKRFKKLDDLVPFTMFRLLNLSAENLFCSKMRLSRKVAIALIRSSVVKAPESVRLSSVAIKRCGETPLIAALFAIKLSETLRPYALNILKSWLAGLSANDPLVVVNSVAWFQ